MEFCVIANSFAAPFVSDQSFHYIQAETPEGALETLIARYRHPAGLYSAVCYASADTFHKNERPLARFLCNHALEIERVAQALGSYSVLVHEPGKFEINGELHVISDAKSGRILPG